MFGTIMVGLFIVLAFVFLGARTFFKNDAKKQESLLEGLAKESGYGAQQRRDNAEKKIDEDGVAATGMTAIAVALFLIAALIFALSVTYTVDAKNQGVVTTFGRVGENTAKPGLHTKAPWQKVTQIDTTIHTDEYHGKSAIEVRMKDGNKGYISSTIRWAVAPDHANKVFEDFRDSDDPTLGFRNNVVSTQFKAATYQAFRDVDPLATAGLTEDKVDIKALESAIEKDLLERSKGAINTEDLTVTISLVSLSEKAQKNVDAYITEVNKTRTATQAQKTAEQQAKANKILADSVSKDPNVLVARCLDLIESGDLKVPAGFSCWPGNGNSVVIPSGR